MNILLNVDPENFCGTSRKRSTLFLRRVFGARVISIFGKVKFKRHVLFCNQRLQNSFRTLLVRKRLKCPLRIESGTNDESVESFHGLVNSRNFERVRRQIIGVSTCRNICRNIDIPRGSCCSVRISVVPSDIALR